MEILSFSSLFKLSLILQVLKLVLQSLLKLELSFCYKFILSRCVQIIQDSMGFTVFKQFMQLTKSCYVVL